MPVIQHPYYAQHQVLTGQYTPGDEFILENGNDYIGGYHVLPSNQFFTGFSPNDKSIELFIKLNDVSQDVKTYNKVNNIITSKYIGPIPYLVRPTLDDYNDGFVYRYFVQKRNNPLVTIIEIDVDQYNKINNRNQPGMNSTVWNSAIIKWKINGSYVQEFNDREIVDQQIEKGFIGLKSYLKDLFQFFK